MPVHSARTHLPRLALYVQNFQVAGNIDTLSADMLAENVGSKPQLITYLGADYDTSRKDQKFGFYLIFLVRSLG